MERRNEYPIYFICINVLFTIFDFVNVLNGAGVSSVIALVLNTFTSGFVLACWLSRYYDSQGE